MILHCMKKFTWNDRKDKSEFMNADVYMIEWQDKSPWFDDYLRWLCVRKNIIRLSIQGKVVYDK